MGEDEIRRAREQTEKVVQLADHREGGGKRGGGSGRGSGGGSGGDGSNRDRVPEDLPVTFLGYSDVDGRGGERGTLYHIMDRRNRYRCYLPKGLERSNIKDMVAGDSELLKMNFPRRDKDGEVTGINYDEIQSLIMSRCSEQGTFDAREKIRGPGAYRDKDTGTLVQNLGNCVLVDDVQHPLGLVDGHVYVQEGATIPAPDRKKDQPGGSQGPAAVILERLRTWTWTCPDYMPLAMLGAMGCAMMAGALTWRPIIRLQGRSGSGKSTLDELFQAILGDACIHRADVTAAYIYQEYPASALAILIDEAEPDPHSRRMEDMVKLARNSSSGSTGGRGGESGRGKTFTVRHFFMFSSILVQSLGPQDINRTMRLELGPLDASLPAWKPRPGEWRKVGQALRRRIMEQDQHWPETHRMICLALKDLGHTQRGQDTIGTLMAMAWICLHDLPPDETDASDFVQHCTKAALGWGQEDDADEWQCLGHLTQSVPRIWENSSRATLGQAIRDAANQDRSDLRDSLKNLGIVVMPEPGADRWWFAVANRHVQIARIFADTRWAQGDGEGVWPQSLRGLPGARASHDRKGLWGRCRFGGAQTRCTWLPVSILDGGDQG